MRIAIGGISHETNTFSTLPTDLSLFERRGVHGGEALIPAFAGTKTIVGGFLDGARSEGFEVVPTMLAEAAPSGTVTAEAFDRLTALLVEGLREAGPVDGVLLELHGAMVAENARDGDAEILRRVRDVVGSIPIVGVLDLHANISDGMVALADALVGYDTYPHVDMYERGLEAAALITRIVRGGLRTARALRKPPLMPPLPKQCTSYETPMRALIELAHQREREPGMVSVTVAAGFPYADVPEAGLAVLAIADGDQARAEAVADEIAALAWERRHEFVVRCTPVEEALQIAADARRREPPARSCSPTPPTTPAPARPATARSCCAGCWSVASGTRRWGRSGTPRRSRFAGWRASGATVELELGGKTDDLHGAPLSVSGRVRLLSDGRFKNLGPMNTGAETRMGPTAVLAIDGVDVVVTSNRVQALDAGRVPLAGDQPVAEAGAGAEVERPLPGRLRAAGLAGVEVDTPGLSNSDLSRYPYQHVRRPIFPLDAIE